MNVNDKTHVDFLNIIGGTAATYRNYTEKRWNKYYFHTYKMIVHNMLKGISKESVVDVGTSHGNWYKFLKKERFNLIYGVELDKGRAELARKCGYTEVFNIDAKNIPLPDASINAAVSNDVFIHILQLDDKIAVLKEIERILKPGGIFIFNHSMARSVLSEKYIIKNHCSFLSLDELIRLVIQNTYFKVLDIKPTYYHFRDNSDNFFVKYLRSILIYLPFAVSFYIFFDSLINRKISIQESDYVYIKLQKIS